MLKRAKTRKNYAAEKGTTQIFSAFVGIQICFLCVWLFFLAALPTYTYVIERPTT